MIKSPGSLKKLSEVNEYVELENENLVDWPKANYSYFKLFFNIIINQKPWFYIKIVYYDFLQKALIISRLEKKMTDNYYS